jgi:xanthine dehydrogenase/oxidase
VTRYPIGYNVFLTYPAYVAIYAKDGSVAVAHGGVEMGQGLNTKVPSVTLIFFVD